MKAFKFLVLLVIIGGALFIVGGIIAGKGDLSYFRTNFIIDEKYEETTQEGNEVIEKITITGRDHRIQILRSNEESYSLSYFEAEDDYFDFSVVDGELILKNVYINKIFNFGYKTSAVNLIEVYIPFSFAGEVNLKTTVGKIDMANLGDVAKVQAQVTTGSIALNNANITENIKFISTTGKIEVETVTAKAIDVKATTAQIVVNHGVFENTSVFKTTTGTILIKNHEAAALNGDSTTGRIIYENINVPIVRAKSTTGNITMTDVVTTNLQSEATTGSINLQLIGSQNDYSVEVRATTGSITFQGIGLSNQTMNPTGSKSVVAKTTTGSISINISE